MNVLVPQHPVFTTPNRISDADWQGWRQERGLYFFDTADPHYTDLVEFIEPFPYNQGPKRGAMVEAKVGSGPLDLPRRRPVAAAAGRHRRRLPADGQPHQPGVGDHAGLDAAPREVTSAPRRSNSGTSDAAAAGPQIDDSNRRQCCGRTASVPRPPAIGATRHAAARPSPHGFGASTPSSSSSAGCRWSASIGYLLNYDRAPDDVDARINDPAYIGVTTRGQFSPNTVINDARQRWLFRMVHTQRPLQEKMALFWHNHFATAYRRSPAPSAPSTPPR